MANTISALASRQRIYKETSPTVKSNLASHYHIHPASRSQQFEPFSLCSFSLLSCRTGLLIPFTTSPTPIYFPTQPTRHHVFPPDPLHPHPARHGPPRGRPRRHHRRHRQRRRQRHGPRRRHLHPPRRHPAQPLPARRHPLPRRRGRHLWRDPRRRQQRPRGRHDRHHGRDGRPTPAGHPRRQRADDAAPSQRRRRRPLHLPHQRRRHRPEVDAHPRHHHPSRPQLAQSRKPSPFLFPNPRAPH